MSINIIFNKWFLYILILYLHNCTELLAQSFDWACDTGSNNSPFGWSQSMSFRLRIFSFSWRLPDFRSGRRRSQSLSPEGQISPLLGMIHVDMLQARWNDEGLSWVCIISLCFYLQQSQLQVYKSSFFFSIIQLSNNNQLEQSNH